MACTVLGDGRFEIFIHAVNTAFLLVDIRVDVKIESCGDIGVTEDGTNGLVVTLALYASSSKSMSKPMEDYLRDIESAQQSAECLAICTRLFRL